MTLSVMSFNTRGSFHDDGVNIWDNRSQLSIDTIKKVNPDVMGLQEAQTGVLDDYAELSAMYTLERGLVSIRQTERRHYVPIYYRSSRFERVDGGGFYLSETPDTFSTGWDAVYPRAVTWIMLQDKTVDQQFIVANTHYNHEKDNAYSRNQSSALIIEKLRGYEACVPCFVMGDFNARSDSDAYQVFVDAGYSDTYRLAGHMDEPNTFHGFQGDALAHQGIRIDWIMLRDTAHQMTVTQADVVRDHATPIFPSDHYPIVTQLEWNTNA